MYPGCVEGGRCTPRVYLLGRKRGIYPGSIYQAMLPYPGVYTRLRYHTRVYHRVYTYHTGYTIGCIPLIPQGVPGYTSGLTSGCTGLYLRVNLRKRDNEAHSGPPSLGEKRDNVAHSGPPSLGEIGENEAHSGPPYLGEMVDNEAQSALLSLGEY